jgi:hypothetical protein
LYLSLKLESLCTSPLLYSRATSSLSLPLESLCTSPLLYSRATSSLSLPLESQSTLYSSITSSPVSLNYIVPLAPARVTSYLSPF